MENELRYYLGVIKHAMEPVSAEEAQQIMNGIHPERNQLVPQYIVTAVKLPNGAIELAVNHDKILEKIDYILGAYDEDMRLKTNPEVEMKNLMVV